MSCASLLPAQSSLRLQTVGVAVCMAPSRRNWPLPAAQRRHPFNQQFDSQQHEEPTLSSSRQSSRSVSEVSPISPDYDSSGRTGRFPSLDFTRRRDTRSGNSTQYQRQLQPAPYSNISEQYQTYLPYQAGAALQSAPSLANSFPEHTPRISTPSWPPPSPSASRFNQYHSYSNPITSFSPVSNNPYDNWQNPPQRTRSQTYMESPTSYSYHQHAEPAQESLQQEGRGYSASSAPGAMQSPLDPSISSYSNYRREIEAVDGFTSPSEFALFVEATSSLNINASSSSSSPWSHGSRAVPTSARLAAPLPPLPRSHSSPAPMTRHPTRQPSRSQLLAEALGGINLEGSDPGSPDDDDELPDYAQSQAEAASRQRREAARRAQELDQMWSSARRRRD
jgi:hypothetical protein